MTTPIVLFGPVGPELVVIFILFLILFGGNKIQQVARGAGEAISEFKRGEKEGKQNISQAGEPQSTATTDTDDSVESNPISKPDISSTDTSTSDGDRSVADAEESEETQRISPEEANIPDLTKNK